MLSRYLTRIKLQHRSLSLLHLSRSRSATPLLSTHPSGTLRRLTISPSLDAVPVDAADAANTGVDNEDGGWVGEDDDDDAVLEAYIKPVEEEFCADLRYAFTARQPLTMTKD